MSELIKEFLNDLENRVLCWEGTQTERNVVKIIKKWKERLEKNGN